MSTTVNPVRPATMPAGARKPGAAKPKAPGATKPRPKAPAAPAPVPFSANRPLFQTVNQVGTHVSQTKNPVEGVVGTFVGMPFAVGLDLLDLFTRPIQAIITGGR